MPLFYVVSSSDVPVNIPPMIRCELNIFVKLSAPAEAINGLDGWNATANTLISNFLR